jgi:hypothetical protein
VSLSISAPRDVRRLVPAILCVVVVAACSNTVPRHPSVYSPPVVTAAPSAVDTTAWATLAPDGEGFSVSMPGTAQKTTDSMQTPGGAGAASVWSYTDSNGISYVVVRVQLKAGSLAGASSKDVLDASVAQETAQIPKAKVVSQSDVTLSGHPGRRVTVANSTTTGTGEFFIAGDDIYFVGLAGDTAKVDAGMTEAFLASFKLTV